MNRALPWAAYHCRSNDTLWEEKIKVIKEDITKKSEDAELVSLKDELEILKYIKDSIDYCINPNGGSGGGSGESGADKDRFSARMPGYCKIMTDRK